MLNEDLRVEIIETYKIYDEVVDRLEVLCQVIHDPETTIGKVRTARQERERLRAYRKELEDKIDRYEKILYAEYA